MAVLEVQSGLREGWSGASGKGKEREKNPGGSGRERESFIET